MASVPPPPGATSPPPAFAPPPPPPPGGRPPAGPGEPLPWEVPGTPFFEALLETVKLFVTRPEEAFQRMAPSGSLGRPILYMVIVGWLSNIVSLAFSMAMQGAFLSMMPKQAPLTGLVSPLFVAAGIIVVTPLLLLLWLFVSSLIVHLFLWIVGGAGRGLDTTVRVLAYAATAHLAGMIPMVGGIVGAVWSIVLQIVGLAEAHGTTRGKAVAAVLLSLVLCCACVGVALVFFGTAMVSALTHAAHG